MKVYNNLYKAEFRIAGLWQPYKEKGFIKYYTDAQEAADEVASIYGKDDVRVCQNFDVNVEVSIPSTGDPTTGFLFKSVDIVTVAGQLTYNMPELVNINNAIIAFYNGIEIRKSYNATSITILEYTAGEVTDGQRLTVYYFPEDI